MSLTVSILGFLSDETYCYLQSQLAESTEPLYHLEQRQTQLEFWSVLQHSESKVDCLILEAGPELSVLIAGLHERSLLFPALILSPNASLSTASSSSTPPSPTSLSPSPAAYHPAEIHYVLTTPEVPPKTATPPLGQAIDQALKQFLNLSPQAFPPTSPNASDNASEPANPQQRTLGDQQQELATKLRERLGYMGVYYKRDPRHFLRNLPPEDVAEILSSLKDQYQTIVLQYFAENTDLNPLIDEFVNTAFFTDISVTKIVEIHMELMDDYSKQLKLEGRSEEILVDYRLTLLDIVAHLCEMYRRSIPRES